MRTPILAVLALVFGLAAAYGVWHYMSANRKVEQEYDVVVVKVKDENAKDKSDIQPDTQLSADMFEVKKKSESQLGELKEQLVIQGVQGRDMEALTKRRSRTKLKAGQPILFELQTEEPGARGIEQLLKPGQVAVTVKGSIHEFGGGHLKPGMHVDVVAKYKDASSQKDRVALLFKDIEVLAVAAFEKAPQDGQVLVPDHVLLRMDYPQSLRMNYFKSIGTISLLLRNPETKDIKETLYSPETDPLFVNPKEETPATAQKPDPKPDIVSGPTGTPPSKPEGGVTIVNKEEHMRIFDGVGVKTYPRTVQIEVAPKDAKAPGAEGAVPVPPAPKKEEAPKVEPDSTKDGKEGI